MNNGEKVAVEFKEVKKQIFIKKLEDKIDEAKEAGKKVGMWVIEHPVETMGLISSGTVVANKLLRYQGIKSEERRRERDLYNPRTGMHSFARRNLKAKEKREIERRYKNGEDYEQILYSMGLNRR